MKPYSHIYLSPHLDDAVLSCGGRIWQQTQSGAGVLVVTIFAGTPPADALLSPLAQALHARWGEPGDAAAARRGEDRAALALLGADIAHWPYTDCIYRQAPDGKPLYADWESLWGECNPRDEELVAELATRIAALPLQPDETLYAPLGRGHHVDHQIVHRAALASGHALVCYDDFPYAGDPQATPAELSGQWQAELALLPVEAVEARIGAIACYRSQISSFWASEAEMAAAVRAFAEQTGGGRPAERYWRPVAAGLPGP